MAYFFGPPCIYTYTQNASTRRKCKVSTKQSPVSDELRAKCLRLFGHVAKSDPAVDHIRIDTRPGGWSVDWKRPAGQPRQTWIRTTDKKTFDQTIIHCLCLLLSCTIHPSLHLSSLFHSELKSIPCRQCFPPTAPT